MTVEMDKWIESLKQGFITNSFKVLYQSGFGCGDVYARPPSSHTVVAQWITDPRQVEFLFLDRHLAMTR